MNKRPVSASAGHGKERRMARKYTKSVEINVNNVISRAGKATTHFYMPISQAKKAQD